MRYRAKGGSVLCLVMIVVLATVYGGIGQQTYAQCETKVLASDGENDDWFGASVAIDSDVMVIGAYGDDDNGSNAGSAYVYRYDGSQWIEEAKLLASDGYDSDWFGESVSISGDVIVIGARNDDENGFLSGSAYVYHYNYPVWTEITKLMASDGDLYDEFGVSVSIDGDVIVVGAKGDNDNGNYSGSAYVFRYDGLTWAEEDKLLASDGDYGDSFGSSVSIDNNTVAIAAMNDEDDGRTGSVYVFRYDTFIWAEETKLQASDGDLYDYFGYSVSVEGDAIVAGAIYDDDNGSDSGSAYVFRHDGSVWAEEDKLTASDGAAYDSFGFSVSIDGDAIVVGANNHYHNLISSGSAYVYRYQGTNWVEETELLASDASHGDLFGDSVFIDSDVVLVGATYDDDNGFDSGSAYVYDLGCGTLTVSPEPLLSGQNATFTSTNLNPNTHTFLAYSLRGLGSTYIAPLNVTLDLDQPAQAGNTIMSNGDGLAEWVLHVPNAGAGRDVWFQACQFELKTNVVETEIE